MRILLAVLGLAVLATGQASNGRSGGGSKPPAGGSLNPVQYDANGWPVVEVDTPPAQPLGEVAPPRPAGRDDQPANAPDADRATARALPQASRQPAAREREPLASGMQLDSPLHDVFRAIGAPGACKALGGVRVFWRLTIHGSHGEAIGIRELTHSADLGVADRDRLEHQDGRVYGRIDGQVLAERGDIPWPTLRDAAAAELLLFGTQLRQPWCFGDASEYAITDRATVERQGTRLTRLVIERRPPPDEQVFGPEANPQPRDRFELLFEPSTGLPRELVHRFANSQQTRRVLLEDWREVGGVRLPHRRIYVDEALRPTTTLEILRVQRERVGDRDFRLH